MKKWLSGGLILLLVMMLAMPAFAAQYASTQDFIRVLEKNDLKYSYSGIDEDNDEKVSVSFGADSYDEFKLNFYFDENGNILSIRMWNLLTVSADKSTVCQTLNDLNSGYKWVKFILDTSDNTITVKMDVPLTGTDDGDTAYLMMKRAMQVLTQEDVEAALLSLK